jgi:hypothetical protein
MLKLFIIVLYFGDLEMFFYSEPEPILYVTSSLIDYIEPATSGNYLTPINGALYSPDYGGQILFDGSNDYINFTSSLNGITSRKFTLSTWIKIPTGSLNRNCYLFSNKKGRSWVQSQQYLTFWNGFDLYMSNGYVYANITMNRPQGEIVYDTGYLTVRSTNKLTDSEFHNITVTSNGGESYSNGYWRQSLAIYINGTASTTPVGSYGTVSIWSHGNTLMGASGAENAHSKFSGSMTSFMFYNNQLTDAQILQNYNSFKTRFGK